MHTDADASPLSPAEQKKFAADNLGLVYFVAKRYARHTKRHIAMEDLVQEGVLGLMRAVQKYRVQCGKRFSTYAVYWIAQRMRRYIERVRYHDKAYVDHWQDDRNSDDDSGFSVNFDSGHVPEALKSAAGQDNHIQAVWIRRVLDKFNNPRTRALIDDRLLSEDPQSLGQIASRFGVTRQCIAKNESMLLGQFARLFTDYGSTL